MKHLTLYYIISLFLCIWYGYSAPSYAGAWLQPEKHALSITGFRHYNSETISRFSGEKTFYNKYSLSHYKEYGWADDMTVGMEMTQSQAFRSESATIDNLINAMMFARKPLIVKGDWFTSIEPSLTLSDIFSPTEETAVHLGIKGRIGYGNAALPIGNIPAYFDIALGVNQRIHPTAHHQFTMDIAYGVKAGKKWLFPIELFTAATPYSHYAKMQLSIVYKLTPHYHIQIGASKDLISSSSGTGEELMISLWSLTVPEKQYNTHGECACD